MKPTLYMLCGLSGSGKSTYAEELSNKVGAVIFSSDDLRKELFEDVNDQKHNNKLFEELHRRIKSCLKSGKSAIYDATNIKSKNRINFLNEIKNIDCKKKCIIVYRPYNECLLLNRGRDRMVPDEVIRRQYMNWSTPWFFEGWDEIGMTHDSTFDEYFIFVVNRYNTFKQHNHHHELTLGVHLTQTASYLQDHSADTMLNLAGYLHDIGKPFTKTFKDSKGNDTKEAHYYQHHCVGAYDVLGMDVGGKIFKDINKIKVSALITYHMHPYFWSNNPKMERKYRTLWGEEFYNDICLLHEADEYAH